MILPEYTSIRSSLLIPFGEHPWKTGCIFYLERSWGHVISQDIAFVATMGARNDRGAPGEVASFVAIDEIST